MNANPLSGILPLPIARPQLIRPANESQAQRNRPERRADRPRASPDRTTWLGRRDDAMLLTAIQTGVRVSELVKLTITKPDTRHRSAPKSDRQGTQGRSAVLTRETVTILDPWLRERKGELHDPLFPTRRGGPLTPRAFAMVLDKHTATAAQACPSLQTKRVTPHTLRHYVDGWVMWPAAMFPVAGVPLRPVPAT
jgi:site-specific recombinase XerD